MITVILDGKEDKVADIRFTYSTAKEVKSELMDTESLWNTIQKGGILDDSCNVKYKYDGYSVRDIFKNEYDELIVRLYS